MNVMSFGGGPDGQPVAYMRGKLDTEGNVIVVNKLYHYSFEYDLGYVFKRTVYTPLSPQEIEYYRLKWSKRARADRERYTTEADKAKMRIMDKMHI